MSETSARESEPINASLQTASYTENDTVVVAEKPALPLHVASNETPGSVSGGRPPYKPQFATETSLILGRMKNGSRSSVPPASTATSFGSRSGSPSHLNPKDSVVQSMSTTLSMPSPASSGIKDTTVLLHGSELGRQGAGHLDLKRKRCQETEEIDFTQNTVAFPSTQKPNDVQLSKRIFLKLNPTHRNTKKCSRCGAQFDPAQDSDAAASECTSCLNNQEERVRLRGKVNQQRQDEIEKMRRKRLAALPQGVHPSKPELVGFGADRASDSSRTEYFSNINKIDLLNLLSLCDQLKPQLLVDLLVSVSKRHPDLPIFGSPDWETNGSNALRVSPNLASRGPKYGPSLINSKAKQKQKATKKILKRTRVIEVTTDVQGDDDDLLPPTWPKAGEGLYAKLPLEIEDRLFLVDENDEEAFSQFMVDSAGRQIIGAVGA